eukprot:14138707-Ditylum_brightwellii.AAC.1
MDKEGFDTSSGMLKDFIKTCVYYEECEPVIPNTKVAVHESPPERTEKYKTKSMVDTDYNT